jgi:hypothetical protein
MQPTLGAKTKTRRGWGTQFFATTHRGEPRVGHPILRNNAQRGAEGGAPSWWGTQFLVHRHPLETLRWLS